MFTLRGRRTGELFDRWSDLGDKRHRRLARSWAGYRRIYRLSSVSCFSSNCAIRAVRLQGASQPFEKILVLDSNHADARYYTAVVYFNERELDAAARILEGVVEKHPHHMKAYYQLALTHERLGENAKAREALENFKRLEAQERDRKKRSHRGRSYVSQASENQ